MISHPASVVGLSDGGAHCGLICDASFPTYLLTHWTRDRDARRAPAAGAGGAQADRRHRPGLRPRTTAASSPRARRPTSTSSTSTGCTLHAPEMVRDLPAGGRRLVQRVDGYRTTVQSGEVTFEDGEPTGARPGKVVRRSA